MQGQGCGAQCCHILLLLHLAGSTTLLNQGMVNFMYRLIGLILLGLAGWGLGALFSGGNSTRVLIWSLIGAAIGAIATPYPARAFQRWLNREMARVSSQTFVSTMVGVVAGPGVSGMVSLPPSL